MAKNPSRNRTARSRTAEDDLRLSPEDQEEREIVLEAQDRFKRCNDWESTFQTLYKDDVKFVHGDSDNGWQWPRDLKKEREKNKRPALTINKTRNYCNLIVNDMSQNKAAIKIVPTGEETSFQAAQIWEGVIRNIEYVSQASVIYNAAAKSAVYGGVGWWRIETRYDSEDEDIAAFNQSIYISAVKNQLGVYKDPDATRPDTLDAMFGFVFEDISKEEAEKQYPEVDFATGPTNPNLSGPATWVRDDSVRIAEYYRIREEDEDLIYMQDEHGHASVFYRSSVPDKFRKQIEDAENNGQEVKKRKAKRKTLQWFKIVGNRIIDRRDLKGRFVPLVRVIGIEEVIDGNLYRCGHVRLLKDPQRMYNYNTSAQTEYGATGTKSPWIGAKEAFASNPEAWANSNIQNAAYLPFDTMDSEGNQIPPEGYPRRPDPPGVSMAYLEGMKIAEHEMDMASGQYQAIQGQESNERTGKAINARQRQGETANYHFTEQQAIAIRATGEIIMDMVPHYYDTERVIQIMGKDGVQSKVRIKPDLNVAMQRQKMQTSAQDSAQTAQVIDIAFNPKIGKYMVEADIGPGYATQRQEAWNAFVQILTSSPALVDEIGDLMFLSADFPMADKIAERLMRKIRTEKPYLFDDQAPTPAMQALQQQVQELSQQTTELLQKLAEYRLKLTGKEQMRDIDAFDAESRRITALSNAEPELNKTGQIPDLRPLIVQTLQDMAKGGDITDIVRQIGGTEGAEPQEQPPVAGARKAQDGNWYVQHPDTGQYMRVQPTGGGAPPGPNGGIGPTPQ